MAATLSLVCKWRCEAVPDFEVRVERHFMDFKTRTKVSLICQNKASPGEISVDHHLIDIIPIFQRCIWKCNDLPTATPLETRLFCNLTNKNNAILIGIDLHNTKLRYTPLTFDDNKFKDHALVFNTETGVADFELLSQIDPDSKINTKLYDGQAEKGIIRPTHTGEQEVVHIWDRVGHDGIGDLRLIRTSDFSRTGAPQALKLELFHRTLWTSQELGLNNQHNLLIDQNRPISDRITNFSLQKIVFLEGRLGDAYSSVTFSSECDIPTPFQGFFRGANLQSAKVSEIAEYVREELLVIMHKEQIVCEVKNRARVEVRRESGYDFGGEHGKHDAICVHLSKQLLQQYGLGIWHVISAFFSGIFNRDVSIFQQLEHLNTTGMQELLQENPGLVTALTPNQKANIFEEFDRAFEAGVNINYVIAENRKIASLTVGGRKFLHAGWKAANFGRWITLRETEPPVPNPKTNETSTAAAMLTPAGIPAATERETKE